MYFYDTTFSSRPRRIEIDGIVGKPIPFFTRLRMNGVGSRRVMIEGVSPELEAVVNRSTNVNYATIEIRPKGIIVHFAKAVKSFAWVIPFYRLSLFAGDQFSIHSEGSFVRIRKGHQTDSTQRFFRKIQDQKLKQQGKV